MNVKRYLNKQAQQDKQEILSAESGEFLRAIQAEPKQKRRPRLKVWLPSVLSTVAAAVVLVTCVVVYYPSGEEDDQRHVEYSDLNRIQVDSTLEELNTDIKDFHLNVDSALYSCTVRKTYDRISGDVLYYSASINSFDTLVQVNFVTVCNPDYQYKDAQPIDTVAELAEYTISYKTMHSIDSDFGFETLNAVGEIHVGTEIVYITNYSEILLTPNGTFLENVQQIVKLK